MSNETKQAIDAIRSGNRAKLEAELLKPRFTASDTEVKHRNITHWDKSGLLNQSTVEGKWRRYNYIEIIWLRIIDHLRSFNISLEVIKNLKDPLFSPSISAWDIYSSSLASETIGELSKEMEGILPEPITDLEIIKAMQNDQYSLLFFMICDAVLLKNHWTLLMNKDGEVIPFKESQADQYGAFFNYPEFSRKTFMSVSLTEVISESFRKIDIDILTEKLEILTVKEAEVLKVLRQGGLKSLRITFDKGDEVDVIEESRVKRIDPETRFSEILLQDGYNTITAKTQKGDITYFEISTRYKLQQVLAKDRPN